MHVGGKCREIDEKARSAVVTVGNSEKSVFVVYTHTHVRHSRLGKSKPNCIYNTEAAAGIVRASGPSGDVSIVCVDKKQS
ncbi:hypothetical protein RRG08_024939 [Elysia crispata]|uniref:Uncharacterized protein n=1 Tax=Elysia crispata TaxID=231223 RepID=A0AAE0Z3G2_9GAST|nr:hypothetical protein RRG08_024939 [Elysia crispata]